MSLTDQLENAALIGTLDRTAIDRLISPRSIAIIGASDRSTWSHSVIVNLEALGFSDALYLVNPKGGIVAGRESFRSCADIGSPIDLAILLVPSSALESAIVDASRGGAGAVVVLASGFSEIGAEGALLQTRIVDLVRAHGMVLLGPNCLGLFNVLKSTGTWTGGLPDLRPGGVAIVSQSGGIGQLCSDFAASQGFGISHVISTGNEAMLSTTDIAAALLEDPQVRAISIFCETIRDPQAFLGMARRAASLAKPVVIMKAGTSALAAEIAQTHTGSLVGEDGIIDAAFRSAGIIRAYSIEDLLITAALIAHTGALPSDGLGVVSLSGGACDIIADAADNIGLRLPALSSAGVEAMRAALPGFATPRNPLDVTGAGVEYAILRDAVRLMGQEDGISLIGAIFDIPPQSKHEYVRERFRGFADGLSSIDCRGFHLRQSLTSIAASEKQFLDEIGIGFSLGGMDHAIRAIGKLKRWSEWLRSHDSIPPCRSAAFKRTRDDGCWSERRALEFLKSQGVPVVPWRFATSEDDAAAAAAELGFPIVIKVVSPDIPHKSDVGGVKLQLVDDGAVRQAYRDVVIAGRSVHDATIEGVIVSSMRTTGVELIVGVINDPQWGLSMTIGFGGIFVEIFRDSSTRLLPLGRTDIHAMLRELRGTAMLAGVRGQKPVDQEALVDAIRAISEAALMLGPKLESLEINPLRADGATIEALDALITWR